jgi:putative transposase
MSETYLTLSHSKWDCKYHVVFAPKRRRKVIFAKRVANWVQSSTR